MAFGPSAITPGGVVREPLWTKNALIISAIVILALLVRLIYLAISVRLGISPIVGDSPGYIDISTHLARGDGFQVENGVPTAYRVPLYPLFLAAVYRTLGTDPIIVGVLQAVFGALTAGFVAATAGKLSGPVAGWVAGLIIAFYPHLVSWTPYVLSETLFVLLAMIGLWLLVEAESRGRWRWFAAAGLALALGTLTRPMLIAFIPLAAATAWWLAPRRERWGRAGSVLVVPVVLITLWMLRNAIVVGTFTLSTQGSIAVWYGNNPDMATYHRGGYAFDPPLPNPLPSDATELEKSALYWAAVRDYLAVDPLSVVRDMPVRILNMWRPWFEGSSVLGFLGFGGSYLVVLALGIAGLVLTLRRPQHQGVRYVQGYVLSLALLHAVVLGEIRYRMPIEPALAILAGIAVAYVASWLPGLGGSRRPLFVPERVG